MVNIDKLNLRVYDNDCFEGLEINEIEDQLVINRGYILIHYGRGQSIMIEAVRDADRREDIYGRMCEMGLETLSRNIERNK